MFTLVALVIIIAFLLVAAVYLVRSIRLIDSTNREIANQVSNLPAGTSPATIVTETVGSTQPTNRQNQTDNDNRPHYTLLKISAPKNNAKSPLAAEHMFTALHGIYRKGVETQEHFSFEIAASSQTINFYMLVPTYLKDFIEGQVFSQYPTVEIEITPDYSNISLDNRALATTELILSKSDIFPIKTFANFDVDPLSGITAVLSKI